MPIKRDWHIVAGDEETICAGIIIAAWCAGPVAAIHTLDRRMARR